METAAYTSPVHLPYYIQRPKQKYKNLKIKGNVEKFEKVHLHHQIRILFCYV